MSLGAPLSMSDHSAQSTGVRAEAFSDCCSLVPWRDLLVHMWPSLGITGNVASELLAVFPPSDKSHHSLSRHQGNGVVYPLDAVLFFSFG